MQLIATLVKGKDLKPGDLFSTADQAYWATVLGRGTLGERVYIRTEEPCPESQREIEVYRITLDMEGENDP
ncbi:MAG: hypothetical protein V3V32_04580 [Dehalococcoidia bacterium]